MIEQMTNAWRYIFNTHPDGDKIMTQIIEHPESITTGQFRIWYYEAREAN